MAETPGDPSLEALQEVCMAILSELDTGEVFRLITEKARRLISAETVAIPVISKDRSTITYREASGKKKELLRGMSLPMSEGDSVPGWLRIAGLYSPTLCGAIREQTGMWLRN